MEREYEQYILARLRKRISKTKSFPLKSELERLVKLLEEKATKSADAEALAKRRETMVSLNLLLDEFHMVFDKKGPFSFSALAFICKLHRSLKKMKQELEGKKNGSFSGPSSSRSEAVEDHGESNGLVKKFQGFQGSTSQSVDEEMVLGFDGKADFLERLLLRGGADERYDKFKAIGIFGAHGVGKTTLCQLVFNRNEVKNHFCPRIWICMSNQPNEDKDNKKEIVARMLMTLGVEEEAIASSFHKHGLQGLLLALHLKLMGNRYLIVLDGAWSTDSFFENLNSKLNRDETLACEKLVRGLPKGHGGTVLVTSSNEEVAKRMVGEEDLYNLLPLSDPESCWKIFKDAVEEDGIHQFYQLEDGMKEEIIKESGGLPWFVKMMGQLMRRKLQETHVSRET